MDKAHWRQVATSLTMLSLVGTALPALAGNYVSTPGLLFGTDTGTQVCVTSTLNVTETTPIIDLDVGLIIDHEWRLDAQVILTSPSGTAVQIVNGPATNNQIADYNILLSEDPVAPSTSTPPAINSASHGPGDATAAPYQIIVAPNAVLSAFDGENPSGNWTIQACDNFAAADDGVLERWELRFAEPEADLALTLASSQSSVTSSTNVTFTSTLENEGQLGATGVTASLQLPAGFTYVSHSGGTYDSSTGIWTVGSVAGGATTSLSVVATVNGSGTVTSEVTAMNEDDADSTPGNGQVGEDDDDSVFVAFTTTPGTPPTLTCSLGGGAPSVLDWTTGGGSYNWPSPAASELVAGGSITQTYTVASATKNVDFEITISGSLDNLIERTLDGTAQQTPVTHPQLTGGSVSGNTDGVIIYVDYDSTSDNLQFVMDLGVPGVGMEQVQFPIYDVDSGAWTDRIVARGYLNGVEVSPIYTTSSSNSIGGGGIIGSGASGNTEAGGNMWVTFLDPVDTVEFDYDNIATQTDPAAQVISLENISFCEMPEADLSASKTVETATSGAYMIPGEQIVYTITIANSSSATGTASDVKVTDTLPDNLTFLSASATGFTGGSFGSPALPAANTNCTGGACVINFENASLPSGTTGEVTIQAVIN